MKQKQTERLNVDKIARTKRNKNTIETLTDELWIDILFVLIACKRMDLRIEKIASVANTVFVC